MSTSTFTLANDLTHLSMKTTPSTASGIHDPENWSRAPIALFKRDSYSRFVVFDGKKEPYIEPHFIIQPGSMGRDPDFDELVKARWYEYLAEGYLKHTGNKMAATSSKSVMEETCVNTPVQLYLAYRRLARARLELKIYTKMLRRELAPALETRFESLTKQSLPPSGVFGGSTVASRI